MYNYNIINSIYFNDTFLQYRKYSTINDLVSDYMKISIKTLTEFKDKIYNIFNNNYHNSFI